MMCRSTRSRATPSGRLRALPARAVVWLVIAALLGMMVMPMTGTLAGPIGGVTLITVCTEHGAEPIALDREGRSVPFEKLHQHDRPCPFCLSQAGSVPLPVAAGPLPAPADAGQRAGIIPAAAIIIPAPLFLTGRQTRAPPAPRA
ncbi:MAG: DUF2946 family protein [Rhodospirillaceae bacterium]